MQGRTIKVVGMSGSSRKGSYNTALLAAAKEFLPEGVSLEVLDITGFPIYNSDLEKDMPENVVAFKQKIRDSDAVLFATPEFNYSVRPFSRTRSSGGTGPTGTTRGKGSRRPWSAPRQGRGAEQEASFI